MLLASRIKECACVRCSFRAFANITASSESLLSENFTSSEIISGKVNIMSNEGPIEKANTSQTEKMPWPAFSKMFYFQPASNKENNLAFRCKFCMGEKIIYANKSSSANLKKHIKAKHPQFLQNIENAKRNLAKRPNEDSFNCNTQKQQKLERWGSGKLSMTQNTLDKAILRFIIEDLLPLSIVDSPAFIDLVRNGLPSSIRIMCRKTVKDKLEETFCSMKTSVQNKLAEVDVVSSTANLWSKMKRSYLGITVHWIDSKTLKRDSAALTCRRIKGKHSYNILAKAINSVFLEYHIQNKVCCTTIDSGSNFVKAFRIFQNDDIEESSIEFHNLNKLLMMNEEEENPIDAEEVTITLPPHHRCISHQLNLIAVKDSEKALEDNISYKRKYRAVFVKLTKLWSKQKQSTQIADKIKDICGVYLKTPVNTKWNSMLDCIVQLIQILKSNSEAINQCLDYCSLRRLTDNDIKFLEEYCQVMEPLARALDILQGENGMYMGYLLPVLRTLQEKLEKLNMDKFTECHVLLIAIQQGLHKRFCALHEKKELIIAACLHPKFKLNWLTGNEKNIAEKYLEDLLEIKSSEKSPEQTSEPGDDFFHFHSKKHSEQEELQEFLKSSNCNIEILNNYSRLKKAFIKYNTPLPSSASVERLFSCEGSVLTPQRGHLNDDTMEHQLLLKINKNFQ